MKGFYTIILLIFSNIFMTFAWYGHLKLQEMKVTTHWPLIAIILLSWGMAFFEYTLQVPANRIFTTLFFQGESLRWNHLAAAVCLVLAVYFVFMK